MIVAANRFVNANMKALELPGVNMRIVSFKLVSWLGPASPLMFMWTFDAIDAALLSWYAALRKDAAYTLLNGFGILVGLIGIARSSGVWR